MRAFQEVFLNTLLFTIPLLACAASGPLEAKPFGHEAPVPTGDTWDPPGKWSLAERQAWSLLREEMMLSLSSANIRCNTNIVADFDYESFRGKFKKDERYGLDPYGRAHIAVPLNAVENICKIGEREQKAVGKGLRRVLFVHGSKGGDAKSTIALRGGMLTPVIEPAGEAAGSWQDVIEAYIKANL
jgi:hypothetical protein